MGSRQGPIDWRFFCVGVVFMLFGMGLALWAFSMGQLTSDQRKILLWAFPVVSAFVCGSFTGSLTVSTRGFWPGVAATATGGFGVWILSYYFLANPDPRNTSLKEYEKYISQTQQTNTSAIDAAAKRDPTRATELQQVKDELDRTEKEIVDNIDNNPGLPLRMSVQKYNKSLDKTKTITPSFNPEYLLENRDPEAIKRQEERERNRI